MRNTMVGEGVSLYLFGVLNTPCLSTLVCWEKMDLKGWGGGGMIEMHNIYISLPSDQHELWQ